MFIHVVHRLNWPILVVISLFAFPLGGAEFVKLVEIWRVRSAPLVQGKVLQREEIRKWGGIPATRLTIKVTNSEDTVTAVMPNHTAETLGGLVQFTIQETRGRLCILKGRTIRRGSCLLCGACPRCFGWSTSA